MTEALHIDGAELPSTDGVRRPHRALLTRGRPAADWLVRRWWRLEVHGEHHVPRQGPVVMAANHVGWMDGPLLAICSPRPVHALTKVEMFHGALGPFLLSAGQIPLDRFHTDATAIRLAVSLLRDGGVVGVFPEGTRGPGEMSSPRAGAAYLGLVTGAPVVPVSFLGTRLPGGHDASIPPRGSRMVMTFGEPVRLDAVPWPRTQERVRQAAADVTAAIIRTMRNAERATGMTLPGPLGPRPERKR